MTDDVESNLQQDRYETEILEWSQVKSLFDEEGCVVFGNPEIRWYQESWGALKKAGLASNTEFEEPEIAQTVLKLRAVCLLVMYLGMYQAAGEMSELGGYSSGHSLSSYLDSLKVEPEDIWELARRQKMLETDVQSFWEDEEIDDESLEEMAMNLVKDEERPIFKVLEEHYGGHIGLFVSMWNSRVSLDDVETVQEVIHPTSPTDGKAEVLEYVRNGMQEWSWI